FPNSGGLLQGGSSNPAISTTGPAGRKAWGVGDPRVAPRFQPGPWAYAILPYLEQEAAYRDRVFAVAVPVHMCPSRGRPNPQTVPAADPVFDYWIYDSGGVNPWGKTDYAANLQVSLGSYANT